MFNKESNKNKEVQGTGSGVNIIGQGTQIEGNIISNGDIRIEGLVFNSCGPYNWCFRGCMN